MFGYTFSHCVVLHEIHGFYLDLLEILLCLLVVVISLLLVVILEINLIIQRTPGDNLL